MALHIKDARAHELARELAQRRGTTLTQAVTEALSEALDRSTPAATPKLERLKEISRRAAGYRFWMDARLTRSSGTSIRPS